MDVRLLRIEGACVFTPRQFADERGVFLEWYQASVLEKEIGHPLAVAQANSSVSRRGVVRGVHYADVPPGQAKYVYCPRGAVLDVVVDLRVGSPTYGEHDSVVLDERDRRAIYIAEGLGHAFCALTDDASLTYLVSTPYDPARERSVHPLDRALALPWPADAEPVLSPRDAAAPPLGAAAAAGALPSYADCAALYPRPRHTGQ